MDIVGYWWRRHFWPDIVAKSDNLLQTFQNLEELTFQIKADGAGLSPRPAFAAAEARNREQRVAITAAWLRTQCPFPSERLRQCLHLEFVVTSGSIRTEMYEGSRVSLEDGWDPSEFAEAFEKIRLR
jgi:hypothetical protein